MKTLTGKMKAVGPRRRAKIEGRAAELIAEEMSLRALREALHKTQVSVAAALGIGQEGVSRLEQRADLLLSTLRAYIEAMGGDLEIVARFPDREPILVTGFAPMAGSAPTARASRGGRRGQAKLSSSTSNAARRRDTART